MVVLHVSAVILQLYSAEGFGVSSFNLFPFKGGIVESSCKRRDILKKFFICNCKYNL